MGPSGAAAMAASAPGAMTPTAGSGASASCTAASDTEAVLQATTTSFTPRSARARLACTAYRRTVSALLVP